MTNPIEDVFEHIDFKTGIFSMKGIELKIKDLTIQEMEDLQDREAEISDLSNRKKKLTATEILKEARKWQEFILTTAFDDEWKKQKIKTKLTAADFKRLVEEVFVFLGNYSGPQGARDYINSLADRN